VALILKRYLLPKRYITTIVKKWNESTYTTYANHIGKVRMQIYKRQ
jgi:hypothetical protein